MPQTPTLDTAGTQIDVERLIETRLLVQANSGAGKSYTLRRLLEQTYGKVQHLVIDVEGEFHTLREKFDYVLAAPSGGDCVADTRSAALLARRLLELGASAIIDIYELGAQQPRFVKLFLDSLMSAPRDLWHSVLVVVDEAHKFCSEKDDSVSSSAVIDLMTRGRKRGFAGCLATQRLSKLDKDAAAEANNLIIGRTALDLDIARAALVLGMSLKDARATLPKLSPGEFFVVGPALTPTVERVVIGPVQTDHPKAGTRGAPPTPPRERIRAILAKLADLPAEAVEEAKTTEQLRARVRELEERVPDSDKNRLLRSDYGDLYDRANRLQLEYTQLDERAAALEKRVLETESERDDEKAFSVAQGAILDDVVNELDVVITRLTDLRNTVPDKLADAVEQKCEPRVGIVETFRAARETLTKKGVVVDSRQWLAEHRDGGVMPIPASTFNRIDGMGMSAIQKAILTALTQRGVLPRKKALVFAGYARSGSTDKAFADLLRREWIRTTDDNLLVITDAGTAALGEVKPLPRGRALREQISGGLKPLTRAIFAAICDAYPSPLERREALERANYKRSGSTDKAFAHLIARDWVVPSGRKQVAASKELFT